MPTTLHTYSKWPARSKILAVLLASITVVSFPAQASADQLRDGETISSLRGPDGLIYPDFRFAGVPGGIPQVPTVVKVTDFGGVADDDRDDSEAISRAVDAAVKKGGGAVFLGPGRWMLDHPVEITRDGIVLRGAGRGATIVESRFRKFKTGDIELSVASGANVLTRENYLETFFDPAGMVKVSVSVAGKPVGSRGSDRGRNVEYWLRVSGAKIIEALEGAGIEAKGRHTVSVTVESASNPDAKTQSPGEKPKAGRWITNAQGLQEWQDAATQTVTTTKTFTLIVDDAASDTVNTWAKNPSMISFYGARASHTWSLAEDGKRGDLSVLLTAVPQGLKRGDVLEWHTTSSEDYKKSILSFIPKGWSTMQWQAVVQGVEGKRVHFNQPLRVDFPVSENPTLRQIDPIRGSGVEALTFVQSVPCLVNSFTFTHAYGCWLRDVEVVKTGRNPFVFDRAKFCEVRDLVATDAWYGAKDNMGGGTAYISFDTNWDSLLDGAVIRGLRHAPNLQGAAQGNVMRRLDTLGTDIQWHAFLTAENLIENSKIRSFLSEGGTYGYGAYASGPDSHVHGPNLQGNVVYGCDVESSETSVLHRGGPTASNWIIGYNRFVVRDQGMALHVQLGLPSLTFIGNVCATSNPTGIYGVASYRNPNATRRFYNDDEGAAVWIAPDTIDGSFKKPEFNTLKVTGLRLIDNKFYGFKRVLAGAVAEVEETKNQLFPIIDGEALPTPSLPTPSLYHWQKETYPLSPATWPTHPGAYRN
jgi:hypothetical protein